MRNELKDRVVDFYRSEISAIRVPAPPRVRLPVRRLIFDVLGMAGIAAASALFLLIPIDRTDNPIFRGAEKLATSAELHASASRALFAAAFKLGKSIAKE